ncbi:MULTISPECIES: hypothetical protein [Leeuwenhoekiella]|jgi:hypothetical protein|uniref:hypothetical protein n=1 Tax=Leeuwenhoekiella TaxID=283735 RepID=UPI00235220DA|nr:hypothetical protein [Leeuwenhoekiella blandensis]|tara:strand:- start:35 stop:511 length:477 start_codon:yes stop_codon:yes gene_type:complete
MENIFINKIKGPEIKWRTIVLNLVLIILISTLPILLINFLIEGKIEIKLILLIVIILAAPFRLIFLKNVVSIQFDSNSQTLIINQKNGFEVPYSKKLNLEETDLSPITENKNELEFDLLGKNKFIRIGSNQRGIAKSDVISIHNYLQEKFDLKVIIIK